MFDSSLLVFRTFGISYEETDEKPEAAKTLASQGHH